MPNDKPVTTKDYEKMRVNGGWVLMPDGLCGRSLDKIAYFREGNETEYYMPVQEWNNLPFYKAENDHM